MNDTLQDVLDRYVDDIGADVPPLDVVRGRRNRRRLRRGGAALAVALVVGVGAGAVTWSSRAEQRPLLRIVDGRVRLTDWLALRWVPEWAGAEVTSPVLDASVQSEFGYWEGFYVLADGAGREIDVYVTLGEPYSSLAEMSQQHPTGMEVVADGGRVVRQGGDGVSLTGMPVAGVRVQVSGRDLREVEQVFDGLEIGEPPSPLPGDPITIASGTGPDGEPWAVVVTRPTGQPPNRTDTDGSCVVARTYVEAIACARAGVQGPMWSWFSAHVEEPTFQRVLIRAEVDASTFEYRLRDGATGSVPAASAFPASGVFAVVELPIDAEIIEVLAVAPDGTVLSSGDGVPE